MGGKPNHKQKRKIKLTLVALIDVVCWAGFRHN